MRSLQARPASITSWVCSSCRLTKRKQRVNSLCSKRSFSSDRPSQSRGKLPDHPARTRFAPSPTGNLHLGSIRTALFNYLLARKTKGQFLLRLEDTDQKRTVPGAEEKLYQDLRWAGLQWDEGPEVGGPHGPYRQSERLSQYRQHIQGLLQSGHAYRCFCTPARLDTLNRHRHDLGQNLGYDRKCASIQPEEAHARAEAGETHVVRFRAPDIWPAYKDLVYGSVGTNKVRKTSGESVVFEDAILVKSDGFPTYHWANICDDHDMKITHVIRGSEWMSSTPLHVAMYAAKGWTPPIFAHVPLLVDQNNQKLSKRNLDTDISSYKANGVFRESLTNFAALLGWSHQRKNDVMDLSELEEAFDLKITKGNTIVSFEKLQYLQSQHSKRRITAGGEPLEQMIRDVAIALLEKFGAAKVTHLVGKRQLRDVVASMLQAEGMPFKSPQQFADSCTVFVDNPRMPKPDLDDPKIANELATAASTLTLVPGEQWHHLTHSENLKQLDVAMGEETSHGERKRWKEQLYHYLRWALLGGAKGPSIPWTMEILGRSICVDRIQRAASDTRAWVQTQQNTASKPDITPTAFKAAAWHPVAA